MIALVKVTLTIDGTNCEVVARGNDIEFEKCVIGNILELIAVP